MATRKEIDDRIEAYARSVRRGNADAVAELFAESIDHIVHGAGNDATNPWNTKRETNREGIRRIYAEFFEQVAAMEVSYTDRIIDCEGNAAALVVRVQAGNTRMENALQIRWDEKGKIIYFYNWYGESL
jgi:hypothetical protein